MTPILGTIASSWKSEIGNYYSISSETLSSTSSTITFSSIPSTYKHLELRLTTRSSINGVSGQLRFNNDTGNNYFFAEQYVEKTAGANSRANSSSTSLSYFPVTNSPAANNFFGVSIVQIPNYTNLNWHKAFTSIQGWHDNELNSPSGYTSFRTGSWYSTSAINLITITVSGVYAVGSTFALYGITE